MMSRETVPTWQLYGTQYVNIQNAAPEHAGREVTRAWTTGIPFEDWKFCRANDQTCTARRAKGTDFCIGHLNAMEKAGANEPS
jgi:hypothetical protein